MDLKKMRKAKEKLNFSSVDIAARSGVPVSTVYKIFQGITENPRQETVEAIERALGLREDFPGSLQEETQYGSYVSGSSALKAVAPLKKQGEYTTDDLDELPDDARVELIDGVIYDLAAPSVRHQIIETEILSCIHSFIKEKKGKCIVVPPVGVRLDCDNKTEVQPDISVTCDRKKIIDGRIFGAPDLAVEVLSPSNRKHDTIRKLKKYREAGVREYWIVDPEEKVIMVHLFGDNYSIKAYTFRDTVPVTIYNDECKVDFSEIDDYLNDIFGDDEEEEEEE